MNKLRKPFTHTRRDAWLEINISNIEHNFKLLKSIVSKNTKIMAVVKADAYGHGSTMISPILEASGVNMFGVASVDEGIQLREVGIKNPILVLGAAPSWSFIAAVENDIQLSIFSKEHIDACNKAYEKLNKKPKIQIKVDTGMNRIGIPYTNASEFIDQVINNDKIQLEGVFTHFACSENLEITKLQKTRFEDIIKALPDNIMKHSANTSATLSFEDTHYDMTRIGIGLYGLLPDLNKSNTQNYNFKQAIGLKGRITCIKEIEKNEGVSYSRTFVTNKKTKIATIPMGYADGVPRALSNKIYGLVNGQKIKQIGNITMDQMMFDITNIKNVNEGDIITLLGADGEEFLSIDDWANITDTIHYEVTCGLKIRLPRVYTRQK